MTRSPPSTTPSSGGRSSEEPFRVVRKRNRVPLSCYPCRSRKKCDRSHPCGNCVKREGADTEACSYATPSTRRKAQGQGSSGPDDMQNRIDRLENLVLALMHGGFPESESALASTAASVPKTNKSTPDSSTSVIQEQDYEDVMDDEDDDGNDSDVDGTLATSLGVLKVDVEQGKSMYIGQEHWHTILTDIAEVKQYFVTHQKDLEKGYARVLSSETELSRDTPTFLLGAPRASEAELRTQLPPKSSILALCGRYFNSSDHPVNIIHGPTFQKQLRRHWQDPSKTPVMWLGLLYAVLCLAMLSYHKEGDEPPEWKGRALEIAAEYRLRTVQCLITADYTKPVEYTVETMILYVFAEYTSRWDADMALWLVMSTVTRISLRMGYHRDPKWFPSLTPFQAEMRRRTWALVRSSDTMFSHLVSLPTMINDDDCDTLPPTNLFDEEFGPDSKVLPPARPVSEQTPVSYLIAKSNLYNELAKILRATTRVRNQVTYDEILKFDERLREVHDELPPHLKLSTQENTGESGALLLTQFNLHIVYLRIICLLHRKYLPRARQNPRYVHSRRSAIEASLASLRDLSALDRESQPGGRLHSFKWLVSRTLTKEFTLPAMLVLLELHYQSKSPDVTGGNEEPPFWTEEQVAEMFHSLEVARDVWAGLADSSVEAFKAGTILSLMLAKLRTPPPSGLNGETRSSYESVKQDFNAPSFSQTTMDTEQLPSVLESNVATSLYPPLPQGNTFDSIFSGADMSAMPSGIGMTPEATSDVFAFNPASPFSMFGNVNGIGSEMSTNIDWETFESYAQNSVWGQDQPFHVLSQGNLALEEEVKKQ